jgi:hypothetical protein
MNATEERMKAKVEANNEKLEVFKVLSSAGWLSTNTGQRPRNKNGLQPKGNESQPGTPKRRDDWPSGNEVHSKCHPREDGDTDKEGPN